MPEGEDNGLGIGLSGEEGGGFLEVTWGADDDEFDPVSQVRSGDFGGWALGTWLSQGGVRGPACGMRRGPPPPAFRKASVVLIQRRLFWIAHAVCAFCATQPTSPIHRLLTRLAIQTPQPSADGIHEA